MTTARFLVLATIILGAAALRLEVLPWNVAPITAMALFGGTFLKQRWLAFALPLSAMLLSDFGLMAMNSWDPMYAPNPVVYACFAAIVLIGQLLAKRRNMVNVVSASLGSSLLFFFVTNTAFWISAQIWPESLPSEFRYPGTFAGLVQSHVKALAFFRNTVVGDLVFVTVFFGAFALAERWLPGLRAEPEVALQPAD